MSLLGPEEIRSFLHYGFVPRVPADLASKPWFRAAPAPRASEPVPTAELLVRGREAFRAACSDTRGALHVLPLSGGLDSRLILGMLVELGLGERLLAVTFGTPGTLDYDLGRAVARAAGVRHEAIDLTHEEPSLEDLAASVPAEPFWVPLLEAHYNARIPRRYGKDAVYWSGIMANSLNGSRYHPEEESTWEAACLGFARESRMIRSLDLCPGFRAESVLPRQPLVQSERLTFGEQLALGVRYPSWYEPCLLVPEYEYRLPFCHPAWVDFTLALPGEERRGERFFQRLALHSFPALFRLPTKNRHGLPLDAPAWRVELVHLAQRLERRLKRAFPRLPHRPPPNTNYVDLDGALRRQGRLAELVRALVHALARRGLVAGLEPDALWSQHRSGAASHGAALGLLAGLEVQLQVRERVPASASA